MAMKKDFDLVYLSVVNKCFEWLFWKLFIGSNRKIQTNKTHMYIIPLFCTLYTGDPSLLDFCCL